MNILHCIIPVSFIAPMLNARFVIIFAFSSLILTLQFSQLNAANLIQQISFEDRLSIEDIKSKSGKRIKVIVKLKNISLVNRKDKTWFRVFGLPNNLKFSQGSKINDVWFIATNTISDLYILSPSNYRGKFTLNFFLMSGNSSVSSILGKKTVSVEIEAREKVQSNLTTSGIPKDLGKPKEKIIPLTEEEETVLLARGEELIKSGVYPPARLIFRDLAKRGSAKAAFALAETYDPNVLKKSFISGVKPNINEAKKWYEKAKQLQKRATH